jgi:hypothetical protein
MPPQQQSAIPQSVRKIRFVCDRVNVPPPAGTRKETDVLWKSFVAVHLTCLLILLLRCVRSHADLVFDSRFACLVDEGYHIYRPCPDYCISFFQFGGRFFDVLFSLCFSVFFKRSEPQTIVCGPPVASIFDSPLIRESGCNYDGAFIAVAYVSCQCSFPLTSISNMPA